MYRRRGVSGWEPEKLAATGELVGFEVDNLGAPWVAVWRYWPEGVVLTRPQ